MRDLDETETTSVWRSEGSGLIVIVRDTTGPYTLEDLRPDGGREHSSPSFLTAHARYAYHKHPSGLENYKYSRKIVFRMLRKNAPHNLLLPGMSKKNNVPGRIRASVFTDLCFHNVTI